MKDIILKIIFTLSTLITFAPKSDNIMPHIGAGANPANSITLSPFNAIALNP